MIETLKLKFGPSPNNGGEDIPLAPITIFIGPNNSGKSKVLSEIYQYCCSAIKNQMDVMLEELKFSNLSQEEALRKIDDLKLVPESGESLSLEQIKIGRKDQSRYVNPTALAKNLQNPNANPEYFCSQFLRLNLIKLDAQTRIGLISSQSAGNLKSAPQNTLQTLFQNNGLRAEVRRIIKDAFGEYLVIDPTSIGNLAIRFSKREPDSESEEKGWDSKAVDFHKDAKPIEMMSDGVKAYTGMIIEVIAGDPEVLIIDEPEAFLHPSLSYSLGKELSKITAGSDKRLFISTHSSDFLMGCIQSGTPVNIIRLTYRDNVATARVLPSTKISTLMKNPLLRSSGVLKGLFYEYVIVVEGDSDRAFYQEINDRLLKSNHKKEWGIPNCLFVNAQNKQTIQTIIKPLRELGIPAVGIVDVDILNEGGQNWSNFLKSGFIPETSRKGLETTRPKIMEKFDKTCYKISGGISHDSLNPEDKESAKNLCEQLAEYGLFVVQNGEVESWLKDLGVSHHKKSTWLIDIFEKMGEDPSTDEYVKPKDDDVWLFMSEIKKWLINPKRKGIPTSTSTTSV